MASLTGQPMHMLRAPKKDHLQEDLLRFLKVHARLCAAKLGLCGWLLSFSNHRVYSTIPPAALYKRSCRTANDGNLRKSG